MEHVKQQFVGGTFSLDDTIYRSCTFQDAQVEYSGGPLPTLIDSAFINCTFRFLGCAGRTLDLLQALNQIPGGNQLISGVFSPPSTT